MSENDIVICSAARTAISKFGGALKDMRSPDIGAVVVREAVKRAGIEPGQVNEVIMGNVLQGGLGQNPARQSLLKAGIPDTVDAFTVNKVCGSGMKAMISAGQAIRVGDIEIAVAGGMENMDLAPYLIPKARYGYRMNDGKIIDMMVHDGLWDNANDFHMGVTGEIVAERYNVTREDADQLSVDSHNNTAKAIESGAFKDEIVSVEVPQRKGDPIVFDTDEGVRPGTTMESLGRLKPIFKKDGIVTAGNSSQISTGASAMVMMSRKKAGELGIKPMAKIVSYGSAHLAPELLMEAPIPASRRALEKAGMTIDDMDLVEHNEAFASASVAVKKELKIPDEKFNVNGGAVALGHPIGCTGSRIMTTLLYALKHRDLKIGLGTLCLGGGGALAMIIERE